MYYRNIIRQLTYWKDKPNHKPLVLRGARQVGKTTVVRLFGAEEFERLIYLNLERTADAALFTTVGGVADLLKVLEVRFSTRIVPGKTLLFIDEIQESKVAMQQLRYFYEEMPSLHVIAAGSLLEVALLRKAVNLPVGRVEVSYLHPLTFDEFLTATGRDLAVQTINEMDLDARIPDLLHNELMSYYLEYALIGGMPEVVQAYVDHQSLIDIGELYEALLTVFRDDVAKYASDRNEIYLRHIIDNAPAYVGKQIRYNNFAESSFRSREISLSFDSLDLAMLTKRVFSSRSTALPLVPNHRKAPKLLFLDIGLCNYKLGQRLPFKSFSELENNFQGQLTEQLVGQALLALPGLDSRELLYWYRDKRGSSAEVDYLISINGQLLPIEVKAGPAGTLKSLMSFVDLSKIERAVQIYSGPLEERTLTTPQGNKAELVALPFYLLHRLPKLLSLQP